MTSVARSHCLFAMPLLFASSGCSLLFDLNATQCEVKADCAALGPQFKHSSCVNQVCVGQCQVAADCADLGSQYADSSCVNQLCVENGGGGPGGGSGSGGMSDGTGGRPMSGGAGGALLGGAGGNGNAGSGAGGMSGQPGCTTNAQCIRAHLDQPYVCKDGTCVGLMSDDCPLLLPSENTLGLLKTASPIVLGGYANMSNLQAPHDSLAVINWDLAFNEFNSATLGGVPNKNGGDPRPVLALICQSGAADITPTLTHLTEELQVPGILSTLSTDKLFSAFNFTQTPEYSGAGGQPVLFVSTGSADLRLANLADDGLVWHMLGDPRQLAATTVALLNKIVPAVNAARMLKGDDPSTHPLRVTLVYSDDSTMSDLFSVLTTPDTDHPETLLSFNGKSAISQISSGEFRQVKVQSSKKYATPDVSNAITDLETNPPHIIVAMATSEFPKTIIPALEAFWGKSGNPTENLARPYYLASHLLYNTVELQNVSASFSTKSPPLNQRVVGVNYAAAQETHSKQLYDSYQGRLQSSYQGSLPLAGTENYYDGAYSLLYSVAAAYAARTAPNGGDLRDGLQDRVFGTGAAAQSVDIGPAALGTTVGKMTSLTYKMSLWGTLGAPDFDRTSGTRLSATSAWCIQPVGQPQTWSYQADGLIYEPTTQSFTAPSAGVPGCLQGY